MNGQKSSGDRQGVIQNPKALGSCFHSSLLIVGQQICFLRPIINENSTLIMNYFIYIILMKFLLFLPI